ncbi:MAG TPA: DNA polymerase III subunit delta, partial [Acetobacteraceae bacterium]|nr:DNA polymerase III subunit delta [Acetobacteraceae bacterium]
MRDPRPTRAVLLYGDDEGLIRERAQLLTIAVAGTSDDPFRVAELDRDAWPQLATEAASVPMTGGDRVVRLRDVTDAVTEHVRAALRAPAAGLIIMEAPGLGKGRLRTLVENAPEAAAIACYPETGRNLQDTIRDLLSAQGVGVEPETLRWLADTLEGDRANVRMEALKLALLIGAGGRLDLQTARMCVGDHAGVSADDSLLAATRGDGIAADAGAELALAEGLNAIALLRMALGHLQRLHQARLRMDDGAAAAEAVRALRPPVFFKAVASTTASLALWPTELLARALEDGRNIEIA